MKQAQLSALFTAAVLACSSSVLAQDPAAPATGGTATTTPRTGKPAPLSSADKKFIKDSTEGMYFIMEAVGQAKNKATTEPVKQLSDKIKGDFEKVWGDIAGFASENGESVPTELKGGDKTAMERMKKAEGDKWDKEFLKASGKEAKKLGRVFATGEKSVQNPQLKEIAAKHAWSMAALDAEFDKAEKEVAKLK